MNVFRVSGELIATQEIQFNKNKTGEINDGRWTRKANTFRKVFLNLKPNPFDYLRWGIKYTKDKAKIMQNSGTLYNENLTFITGLVC